MSIKIRNKFLLLFTLLISIFILNVSYALASTNAQVIFVEGEVNLLLKSGAVKKAEVGQLANIGDALETKGDASAKLKLADESLIRLDENTKLEILGMSDFKMSKTKVSSFKLWSGRIRALVIKSKRKNTDFRVDTPNATIGVRGTDLIIKYEQEITTLDILDGFAFISGLFDMEKKEFRVERRQRTMVKHKEPAKLPEPMKRKEIKELEKELKLGELDEKKDEYLDRMVSKTNTDLTLGCSPINNLLTEDTMNKMDEDASVTKKGSLKINLKWR